MQEEWRPVVGYEGIYEVSNLGRIKSLNRVDARGRNRIGSIMSPSINLRGYKTLVLYKNKRGKSITVHKIVCMAFIGNRPNGLDIDHIDGNKTNNRLDNLRYITHRENTAICFKNSQFKYTGVYNSKNSKKYYSRIQIKGKRRYLGSFDTEYEAGMEYRRVLAELQKKEVAESLGKTI